MSGQSQKPTGVRLLENARQAALAHVDRLHRELGQLVARYGHLLNNCQAELKGIDEALTKLQPVGPTTDCNTGVQAPNLYGKY